MAPGGDPVLSKQPLRFPEPCPGFQACTKEDVRQMINFFELNLTMAWPVVTQADIVFIRNVLIYLDNRTKQCIQVKMQRILKPVGYLFLGTAATTLNIDDTYKRTPYRSVVRLGMA
ncbi:MAG TPA: hypothetical protein EYQ20_06935 [candidate division Zixibacteria bacterium]|nr:hypothetical protein [candidate division Zixibacteria bacterium]